MAASSTPASASLTKATSSRHPSIPVPSVIVPPAVRIEAGEAPPAVVVQWDPGDAAGPAAVDLYDADASAAAATPLRSVSVVAGQRGVAILGLDPARAYQAVVTVTGGAGAGRRLGPSEAFRLGSAGPVVAGGPSSLKVGGSSVHADGPPCLGAGYGVGSVNIDGWAGVQGSYCAAPAFSSGTGAFCIDHGLDYPAGAYHWAASVVGGGVPLVNQYDHLADVVSLGRLAWVIATYGSTSDPARAVAIGVIAHAVMGDYPGLTTADLDPARMSVAGGDSTAITADVASMWSASAGGAGPDAAAIHVSPGPYVVGHAYRATVKVTHAAGGPVPGIAIGLAMSGGVVPTVDSPAVTGPDGTVGFTFRPTASSFSLDARTGLLPTDTVTLWTPERPPVPVQRVVSAGPEAVAVASLRLTAGVPGQATLVKASSDPHAVPVGAGFGFDVARGAAGGTWTEIAHRQTGSDGSMAPIPGLLPGAYRVTETARPAAFEAGGPWTFSLASGQRAEWQMSDTPLRQPVRVVKAGDDVATVPIGAGVGFALSFDSAGDGRFDTPAGTLTTETGGVTPSVDLEPGRYRLVETTPPPGYEPGPPVTFTVPPVGAGGPQLQSITVTDAVIPGTLRMVKTDATTGDALPGADLHIERLPAPGSGAAVPGAAAPGATSVGDWVSGAAPLDIGLPPGHYLVSEIRPPAGYQDDAAPERVSLHPGQTIEITFADRLLPAPAAGPATGTTAASTTAPPGAGLGTGPASASAVAVGGATLAFTGLPLWRWLLAAAAALAAGLTLVQASRRHPVPTAAGDRSGQPEPASGARRAASTERTG